VMLWYSSRLSLTAVSILKNAGHAIKLYKATFIKQLMLLLASPLFTLSKSVMEKLVFSVSLRLIYKLLSFFYCMDVIGA